MRLNSKNIVDIKSIMKPIGEMFSWIGNTVGSIFGKVAALKEFEKKTSIAKIKTVHTPIKLSNVNSILNNNAIKEMSERSRNNVRIQSFIEEKRSVENDADKVLKDFAKNKLENKEEKILNKTQHITNNYHISIKAEPNQDVRSLADEVIKRIREKSRDVMFDRVDPIY